MLVRDVLPLLKFDYYSVCKYDDEVGEYIAIFDGQSPQVPPDNMMDCEISELAVSVDDGYMPVLLIDIS